MTEPVMMIQTTLFTRDYNNQVVHALQLTLLFYKLSFIFIETDVHLWPLSDCKQPWLWLLLRKKKYLTTIHRSGGG